MTNLRILVIEDDPLIRDVLVARLAGAGFIVVPAGSAAEAFEAVRGVRIDLLFVDVRRPGAIDGWRIASRMREERPNLPVVHTSGAASPKAPAVPNVRVLKAPFRVTEAQHAIKALLREAQGERGMRPFFDGWAA